MRFLHGVLSGLTLMGLLFAGMVYSTTCTADRVCERSIEYAGK